MSRTRNDRWRAIGRGALGALLASFVLAAPAQASAGAQASIIGGTATTTEEWPWTAFVLAADRRGEGFACTGTVVAPTLVLTAAHCVEDIATGGKTPVGRYTIVTGSSDVRDKTVRQVSRVRRALIYPGYNRFKVHGDAAVLELATATTAPPVALAGPTDVALFAAGTPVSIAGWGLSGATAAVKLRRLPVLRRAATVVQRRIYCRNHARVYYPFFNFSQQLCTITRPGFTTGPCHGDSGGPALAFREDGTPVQIGITSLGPSDCDTRRPDIYTRVDLISAWVGELIAGTTVTATG